MNVGIIGAGFTGLAAAYELGKTGYHVTIFEKDEKPGGLAIGYKEKNWKWTLEQHYHHWFTNDTAVLSLASELGHSVIVKTPHTNWYVNAKIYPFVSLKAALSFPLLNPFERTRHLAALALLRFNPYWKVLEKLNATTFLPRFLGKKAYTMLWEPLFQNKFGKYAKDISLAWFWARIVKRTQSLAYPEGGFLAFAEHLVETIKRYHGTVLFNHETLLIEEDKNKKVRVVVKNADGKKKTYIFDKVIVTLPSFLFVKIAPSLPSSYTRKLVRLKGIGAINLILRLQKPFFRDSTYWLSIADNTSPIMTIVEHTNFMDKKYYDNEHIVYLGNYLDPIDPLYSLSAEKRLLHFDPFLKKINPNYKKILIGYSLFKAPFAQPIIPRNYSRMIPSMTTPFKNVFLANIEQVYPWDRGTNYAVELGKKVAQYLIQNA